MSPWGLAGTTDQADMCLGEDRLAQLSGDRALGADGGANPQGGCSCALVMPTGMGEMRDWDGSGNEHRCCASARRCYPEQ